jgi:hypothetical protein
VPQGPATGQEGAHQAEVIDLAQRRWAGQGRETPPNEPEVLLIAGDAPRAGEVPDRPRTLSRIYPIGVRDTERGPKVTGWRSEDGTILGTEDDFDAARPDVAGLDDGYLPEP